MKKFFNYFLKSLAFILAGWALGRLFPAYLGIVDVNAMTVSGQNVGAQTWSVNPSTDYWYVNKSIDNYWNGWGSGYVYFNIGISKRTTDSVTPLVSPKSIVLSSGTTSFACSIGTNSVNNSTYINQNYSVVCPVNFSSSGLTLLTINLMPLNNTPINTYEIYFDGFMSFVNDSPDVNVNVDNSSSNSNRDQNFGNLITDNRNNTNTIIQNNDDNTNKITGSVDKNTEENKKTNEKLDKAEETRQGIWETIKGLPGKFLDMLKGLFIPDNFDFLDDFKEVLEDKLGFIAEVPLAVIDFILGLATASWDDFNSITLPTIDIFGVNFWNSQEISLQPAIDIFSPYKYITDVICVALCVNTLKKWYDKFASGGGES